MAAKKKKLEDIYEKNKYFFCSIELLIERLFAQLMQMFPSDVISCYSIIS